VSGVCLIVNPAAGGGKGRRRAPAAESALRARGLTVRRTDTQNLAHARELAVEAAARGETVVALSGDGLVGTIADALRGHPQAVLGIIPGGRGNDLANVLEIPDDPAAAAAIVAEGEPRRVDLGLVEGTDGEDEGRAFVGIASVGFDSEANRIANEAPSWLGGLVYAYGALRALLSWRPARFEVELDPPGERRSFSAYTVGAANSRAYGGGMRAAPDALLDDGLLEVIVLERVSKLRFLLRILPRAFSGAHVREPCVHIFRAREVRISCERPFSMYADGDPIGELPVTVRALPGAITILLPRGVSNEAFGSSGPAPAALEPPAPRGADPGEAASR